MFQTNFSKILGPFSLPLGASAPFSNSHSHATYPQFFSHLSTSILRLRGSGGYLPQRHPYTKTYYVTPTLSSTFHKVSSLNYLTLFFTKRFQIFFGPFPGAPGAHDTHFRIPLLTLHTLKFFPTSPPPFYAYTEAVAPNLQRYPYISIISLTSTQG